MSQEMVGEPDRHESRSLSVRSSTDDDGPEPLLGRRVEIGNGDAAREVTPAHVDTGCVGSLQRITAKAQPDTVREHANFDKPRHECMFYKVLRASSITPLRPPWSSHSWNGGRWRRGDHTEAAAGAQVAVHHVRLRLGDQLDSQSAAVVKAPLKAAHRCHESRIAAGIAEDEPLHRPFQEGCELMRLLDGGRLRT